MAQPVTKPSNGRARAKQAFSTTPTSIMNAVAMASSKDSGCADGKVPVIKSATAQYSEKEYCRKKRHDVMSTLAKKRQRDQETYLVV